MREAIYPEVLCGRRKLHTGIDDITADNVIQVLNSALIDHLWNVAEEEYLYWYRRGIQPVLEKEKHVREEINNKIVENIASSICAFKNGYFLTKPTFYTSRKESAEITDQVNKLNDFLYLSGKQQADNDLVDWFHTVGVAPLFVEAVEDEEQVKAYALDPRQAADVYSYAPGEPAVMGFNVVLKADESGEAHHYYDVFTKRFIFHIKGLAPVSEGLYTSVQPYNQNVLSISEEEKVIESIEPNLLGEIPIIEYTYDRNRMGAFEVVLGLLDAVSALQSDRLDSDEQFVNSLLVFYNCQLGQDENGNDITPQMIREAGAIFLKSVGQDKADLKEITSVLDQQQTQVFMNDLLHQICNIAGMPFTGDPNTSDSSNVGATFLRNGWQTADTYAHNTEDLYRASNKQFDKIFLKILKQKNEDLTLKASDIDVQFTRSELDNLLVKTQGALNLKQIGLSPELVLSKSGVSNDPVGDVKKSQKYIEAAYALGEASGTDNRTDIGNGTGRRDTEEPTRNNNSVREQAPDVPAKDGDGE